MDYIVLSIHGVINIGLIYKLLHQSCVLFLCEITVLSFPTAIIDIAVINNYMATQLEVVNRGSDLN